MIYSEYGNTGNMVSAVGFGGMRFDTKKRTDKENAEIVLDTSNKTPQACVDTIIVYLKKHKMIYKNK